MAGDKGLFRYGFEREEGVAGPELISARFESEDCQMTRTYETDPNLDPSGNETEGEVLKAEGSAKVSAAANSESWLQARIHHHGFYVAPTTPAAGVRLWELRDRDEVNEAEIAHYIDSLHFGVWRDEVTNPTEFRGFGLKVDEFTIRADANKYAFFDHEGPFLRDRYVKKPDVIVDNVAFEGFLEVDGHRAGGDENGDYYKFKVIVGGDLDGGAPIPTIQFGKGVAAYAGATYQVIANEWMYVRNTDGTIAGPDREPLRIRFISDLTDALVAGQEWRILATSPKPVPVFSARPNLSAPACEVRFSRNGGTTWFTRRIEGGFSLKMGRPREPKFGLGSVYAQTIGRPDQARKWWELGFNGTYENLELIQAMLSGVAFQAYARFDGTLIGASGLKDFSEFTLENLRVTKAGAVIANPGDLPENPTLRAFSTSGSSLCIEKHQNTITTVVPVEDVS